MPHDDSTASHSGTGLDPLPHTCTLADLFLSPSSLPSLPLPPADTRDCGGNVEADWAKYGLVVRNGEGTGSLDEASREDGV